MSRPPSDRGLERVAQRLLGLIFDFGEERLAVRIAEQLDTRLARRRGIHDRGPAVVAVAAYMSAHPSVTANDVVRSAQVPFARGDILWAVRELRSAVGRYCEAEYHPLEVTAERGAEEPAA